MKKILAIVTAVCLLVCFCPCVPSFGEDLDYKFKAKASSVASDGSVGSATGTVYTDFSADLIFDGTTVNRSNVKAEVWMKNVDSLGVSEERYYVRNIDTHASSLDKSLSSIKSLFAGISKGTTTVTGVVLNTGSSTKYTLTRNTDTGNVYAASDPNASTVWHDIVNETNVKHGEKDNSDSKFTLANGSWLQVGARKLQFQENYTDDLVIDDVEDYSGAIADIRAALEKVDADDIKVIRAFLKAGTRLDLGSHYAELLVDTYITIDIDDYEGESALASKIDDLWACESMSDYINTFFTLIEEFVNDMGGKNTTVTIGLGGIRVIPYPSDRFEENANGSDYTYTVNGQVVTVTCPVPCRVGYLKSGETEYTALVATEVVADSRYSFTAPEGTEEVILVVKGDVNLDGKVSNADSTKIKAHIKHLLSESLNNVQLFAGDVNDTGKTTNADSTKIKAHIKRLSFIVW